MATVSHVLGRSKVVNGDYLVATVFAESFGFTEGNAYKVLATSSVSVFVEADNGERVWVPSEYFQIGDVNTLLA